MCDLHKLDAPDLGADNLSLGRYQQEPAGQAKPASRGPSSTWADQWYKCNLGSPTLVASKPRNIQVPCSRLAVDCSPQHLCPG